MCLSAACAWRKSESEMGARVCGIYFRVWGHVKWLGVLVLSNITLRMRAHMCDD